MKKLSSKFSILSAFALFVTLLINACSVEDLTKDLTIYTGNNFLVNPISIQIGDAAHLQNAPDELTVSIEGRDKAKIFSLLGESKIHVVGGIVALAVKTPDAPTMTNPIEFTLVLSAPNYLTVRKNYTLTRDGALSSDKIAMINLTDAPAGVSVQNTSFSSAATGTAENVALASPMSIGKEEQTRVTINAGTQPLAADGSVLSGTIQAELVHYDARSEASLSGITEGFNNLMVKTGTTTAKTIMNPAGFYSLAMSASGKSVSKFSQPLDVTMDIDPDFFNEAENRKIQAGDVLDVISRTESESVWTVETKAVVTNVNGHLKANFKQPHLSFWVMGNLTQAQDVCTTQLKINSDLPTSVADCAARASYKYKLVNAANNSIVYKEGTTFFNNGEILDNDVRSDNKIDVQFIILNMADVIVYTSPAQNLCNNPSINIIGKLPANNSVVANVNVSGFCAAGAGSINTELVPNGVNLWYRNMASPDNAPFGGWSQLVTITNGKGCAKGLVAGQTYDFALPVATTANFFILQTFSKELKQPKGLTIPLTGDLEVKVKSPVYNLDQMFTIKRSSDGVFDVTYVRYPLPTNICQEIDKRFSVYILKK
jgi:hypothetical protein